MAAQQQQQQGDNSLAPLWITAGLFIFGWIIWIYARGYIVAAVLKLKLVEASFIGLFAGSATTVADGIHSISPVNYDKIPFDQLITISTP